ncbi:hypothetical protein FHS55_000606 [Angulomicrobium tetraedrale]|uniref:DUF1468 domain-containing protein n=1 Tax=Ancylobacter tetraedralis TaxID=217068 RepID=A0A839Z631_9HYPH|nr:tripartite tricarboxylate transporter TctB family protein [Ancylobacter tetraedralis]MBB3770020.1 hypothetical protein [Ancylobacter tetraedralis]
MSATTRNRDEIVGGLLIAALGAGVSYVAATHYPMGTAARMGTGYMPTLLGAALAVLGLLVTLRSLVAPEGRPIDGRAGARPLALVLGSVILFALLVGSLGVVVTGIITVVVAALGSRDAKWREVVPLAISVSLASSVVFVKLLGLPFKFWPFP